MSMIAKTEKHLAANRPGSKAALSIQSIIKDLQDLDKSLITKNQLEAMKTKMKHLEEENSRMKTELQATEADRKLYYNQFHQNVKELNMMKAENQSLKEEIASLKMTEASNTEEITCSSFQSAIPVHESRSEIDDSEENQENFEQVSTLLAIDSGNKVTAGIGSKRTISNEEPSEPNNKKAKIQNIHVMQLWKCTIQPCEENRFTLVEDLRSHIVDCHPERKFVCNRCPFSTTARSNLKEHERCHITNDLKYNGVEGAKKCALCDIYFNNNGNLTKHNQMFH